jgi:tRNA 5-methylaminomethyl-2-thiouridine biosynthesis bifunctional protein
MDKTRLPPSPQIDWKDDGTPESTVVGDVYFSVEDGLEEARAVFLAGCGLPERWSGRERFGIGELGFGTGLNFLATCQLWRAHRPSDTAKFDFVSFEGFPLERDDAERALSRWPDLGAHAYQLMDKWPVRMRGVQRITFSDGVSLTLHVDEISEALPRAGFQADAWFLDGFAPAKNSAMWDDALFPQMLARSNQDARVGTYTVAGAVRRGLSEAGFEVRKAPGFGRKRERLEAVCQNRSVPEPDRYGLRPFAGPPSKIAVIGAGIAGACMARKCIEQGGRVTVFDEAEGLGAGASGNRLALVMPRLDVDDTVIARAALEAYIGARSFYRDFKGVASVDVQQVSRGVKDGEKFAKLRADPPLDETLLGFGADGRLIHKDALVMTPDKLLPDLLSGATLRLGARAQIDVRGKSVNGERFDAIILASGMAVADLEETSWLPLTARLGQVEYAETDKVETSAIAAGHYGLAAGQVRLWGASFEPFEGGEINVSDAAKAANANALEGLGLSDWLDLPEIRSRAGVRATTPDKLPICGAVPEFGAALDIFAPERKGIHVDEDMPCHDGVFVLGGLGSRGFGFAPLLADVLASQLFGGPLPTEQDVAEALSPVRFLLRGLKRGQL